ncbi:MAG: Nif3-like dinuclear metal center hexameric protein [Bacteroidota bacterium]|nr:Nif3-like dinuclear metal center hexameric protein [Bacteroidota bacterium]MDX5429599.1 Nif3-like dinuclear metal center hexameric protein [Bacteroidota bacterium]MDX5468383.1 Nif3-like dinuclear metal center hexameric protein [Bacteroidota bacterium]
MQLRELIQFLEQIAPPSLQESYDNSGLLVGQPDMTVQKAVVCLDSTPEVVEEARKLGANLIIAHHPIVFSGLKRFNGKNYVERAVMAAIKHDIAIYAIHTNLDNVLANGVNQKMAEKLGLTKLRILEPRKGDLRKLTVFCPDEHAEGVRLALFKSGAGKVGNYDACSFNTQGDGSFRALEGAKPFIGEIGKVHWEPEIKIEVLFPVHLQNRVLDALRKAHPYEEVAYDVVKLENAWQEAGSGMIGEFETPLSKAAFLERIKTGLKVPMIRYTESEHEAIQRVAICGGSGSFLLPAAMASGAQAFLSSDFKYHQFFDGEGKIMIADVGHYEGEYFTIELLVNLLTEKFPTFAVVFSGINTNPLKYYC